MTTMEKILYLLLHLRLRLRLLPDYNQVSRRRRPRQHLKVTYRSELKSSLILEVRIPGGLCKGMTVKSLPK
jgi:hypothetical protein